MNTRKPLRAADIAAMIDHSLLNPTLTLDDIREGCRVAREYDVASVCVKPSEVDLCRGLLEGSDVLLSTVIGFPHGSSTTETKVFEARDACARGCKELDMVLNIGRLLSGDHEYVEADIRAVAEATHAGGAILKVILENAYLTDAQKTRACALCEAAGADFVKTSTGYAPGGATLADLRLMRASTRPDIGVKAAGGVRTLDSALSVRATGATRFGATATGAILDEARQREADGALYEAE